MVIQAEVQELPKDQIQLELHLMVGEQVEVEQVHLIQVVEADI